MDAYDPTSNQTDDPAPVEVSRAGGVALSARAGGDEPAAPAGGCPADTARWQAWLEESGFSHAEAGRLIFERLRPREEGTARV
jgi:hypothetical protein